MILVFNVCPAIVQADDRYRRGTMPKRAIRTDYGFELINLLWRYWLLTMSYSDICG